MLKRYWLFIFALGLVMPALSGQAQEQNENPQGSNTEEGQPQILPLPIPVEIIESNSAADARQRSEDEAKEREIRDLAAQEGVNVATQAMNDATQRMANYALWSTLIVGLGTTLLFWTLWETRKANRSAQAAVDVTREIGQAQVRAYVGISEVMMGRPDHFDVGKKPYVEIQIKNSGTSPALDVRYSVTLVNLGSDIEGYPKIAGKDLGNSPTASIAPMESIKIVIGSKFEVNKEIWASIFEIKPKMCFYAFGRITYIDVFGTKHTTRFCLKKWPVRKVGDSMEFMWVRTNSGNEAD